MFDDLLTANAIYAETFPYAGYTNQAKKGLAVVSCMDTRVDPFAILGLSVGDAKILRNGAGRATSDVLRSLVLAYAFLGVRRVLVLHHTDCAIAGQSNADIRVTLSRRNIDSDAVHDFFAMPDPDAALVQDVESVRNHPSLQGNISVAGWRYNVANGRVSEIVPAT